MGINKDLARAFDQTARLLELTGADGFRVNAHARIARLLEDSHEDFEKLAESRDALLAIDGVGAKMADKIQEFVRTGTLEERDALLKQVPSGLLRILDIPGLGPKTVRAMWTQLDIKSVEDLKKAIEDGSILSLPRMGAKSVEKIRSAISFAETSGSRVRIGLAMPLAERIVERLRALPGVDRAEYAGSLRRGRDTIGDIDIIAASNHAAPVGEAFRTMPEVREVLAAGETKSSVRAAADGAGLVQVDLRVVPHASFGAALLYFTGSKEHNVRLRERAQKHGLTLNEYGLYPDEGSKKPPQDRGVAPVASDTEHAIYTALKLPFIPPEQREDCGETRLPPAHDFRLVSLSDIRAELHAHTTASDGRMSIVELAQAARARGFHTIAVTDHSKSQAVAGGLTPKRLREHIAAIQAAREQVEGITILAGTEVDILPDGSLDYDDDLLALLDIVVASPHFALTQKPDAATKRLLRAIEHPLVDIIGHPTGRMIDRREGLSPESAAIVAAAVEHDTALEINANWRRLDLRDSHVRAAVEGGALLAINCDTHTEADMHNLRYGVLTARRGGLTTDRCVNCWPAEQLHAWLRKKRAAL